MTKMLKRMRLALRTLIFGLLIVLCVLLGVLLGVFLWYRNASLPQIDGNVQLNGLHASVATIDIVRDREGIPHIYAKSADDAYFALGFAHAQDRLWQMELNRRIPAGTMAEILGPGALDADRFLRTLGVRSNAEAILSRLSDETRVALDAYAKGVNAYLAHRKHQGIPLPPEFLITGASAPAPWQPADSIAWQTMMAWDLGANWSQELLRMRLSQRLSLQQIQEFLAPYPGDVAIDTQDYTKLYRELSNLSNLTDLTGAAQQLAAMAPPSWVDGMGSNNWVVSGALSRNGKPLLANDPHLGLTAPALWYFAHLSAPGLNVIGATLPGMPVVVLGHNDRIAWGFTNTASDVQDLYIERIDPDRPQQYQTPEGWANFKVRTETIKVKGQSDVTLQVRETRHGPVITGALPIAGKAPLDPQKYVIAFAWTALRPDDLTLQAGMRFNRAKNWEDFLAGAKDFGGPQQNIVYADVDGNIGFIAPARVPIRKPENDLKGLTPAPGWDARYDWNGFIPFDRLPRQYNPASQRIVTANQKIIDDHYPYFLTSEWALPFRAQRIEQLLDANVNAKHTLDTFAGIQKDDVSLAAQELLPILRKTIPSSARAKEALDKLANWNGEMDASRPEPLIFNAWAREISRQIFADELGDALMKDYWEHRNMHRSMVNVLKNVEGQSVWCNNGCTTVLSASLEIALKELGKHYGNDMSDWRWGDAHIAKSEHRPFSKIPFLAKLFDIRIPSPGDTFTVNVGRYNLRDENEPFASRHAPSLRALYDVADWDNSRFMHSTGQSGHLLSPFYRNFAQRWVDAAYVPMQTKRDIIEKDRVGTLTLIP